MAWVPTGPGAAFRPLRFWEGSWSEVMRPEPGTGVALHRHHGPLDSYGLEGCRLVPSGAGFGPECYQHEPAGTVDEWTATGVEACVVHLRIEGDIEYLGDNGSVVSVVSSATQSAAYRRWREAHHVTPVVVS